MIECGADEAGKKRSAMRDFRNAVWVAQAGGTRRIS